MDAGKDGSDSWTIWHTVLSTRSRISIIDNIPLNRTTKRDTAPGGNQGHHQKMVIHVDMEILATSLKWHLAKYCDKKTHPGCSHGWILHKRDVPQRLFFGVNLEFNEGSGRIVGNFHEASIHAHACRRERIRLLLINLILKSTNEMLLSLREHAVIYCLVAPWRRWQTYLPETYLQGVDTWASWKI